MFPLNSNQAYIKDTGERTTLGAALTAGGGGGTDHGIPSGGTTGQVLTKQSSADYAAGWATPDNDLPAGGTTGQVLTKQSSTDYAAEWAAPVDTNPVGTIINFLGENAPTGYLKCDGTAYNKADYAGLSAHLLALTSHTQYEVDGDATKFKVPDLRGEFLRGTGTNSHSGNGNGDNVGVHQDSTQIPAVFTDEAAMYTYSSAYSYATNTDTKTNASAGSTYNRDTSFTQTNISMFSTRPTNTSVLYCIKY